MNEGTFTEIFIDPVSYYPDFFAFTVNDREVIQHHEQFHVGHHAFIHILPVAGSGKDCLCLGMIYDMMYIIRFEFM